MGTGASGPPGGTFTFLLSDVEASTRLWEEHPGGMGAALARHDAIVAEEVARTGGVLVRTKGEGDSAFAVFDRATEAADAAVCLQQRLRAEPWDLPTPIHVRIAVHTGEAEAREGDYYGIEVNRCARLRAIAYGGQVLLSGKTAALVRDGLPQETNLLDLGIHRLKDLSAPEHVFQLVHPDLEQDFPPLLSLDARPHNLPVELTSFLGRESELAEIETLVMSHRLVTLLGPGGTGKTRLALQIAGDLIEKLPDGAWLVQLAPITNADLVAQTLVSDLRLPGDPTRSAEETIVARLKDRAMLVVLDNCEQVAGAVCSLVQAVLTRCPDIRIIATSRERLGSQGEAVYQVEPIKAADAVALFAERARLVRPGFEVTTDNAETIDQVCRRVDSLPLAIELAASRVRSLPPREILDRLTDTFRVLRGTDRARAGRHESLGAAIDWSYSLLDEQEKAVFRRLAVFVGGFGISAAEGVCAADDAAAEDVLDILARLVDKSMVVAGEGVEGKARYRLLETMREYGLDRLVETGEDMDSRNRHLAYYRSIVEGMNAGFDGPDQAIWLDRTQEEVDNFRAAFRHADDTKNDDALVHLAGALGPYFYRRALWDGHTWPARVLTGPVTNLSWLRAAIWGVRNATYLGEVDVAVARSDGALAVARTLGDRKWIVRALTEAAQVRMATGEFSRAFDHANEAVELAREAGDDKMLLEALHRASTVELRHGSAERARALADEAIVLARRPGGDPMMVELALYDAAWSAIAVGELESVPGMIEETFASSLKYGDMAGIGMSLNMAAIAAAAAGNATRALRLAGAGSRWWDTTMAGPGPEEQGMLDQWVGRARDKLGSDAAERAWQEGWSMPQDDAIAYALRGVSGPTPEGEPSPLTPREMEIAESVANGLTNGEIADKLTLSERTVDAHLDHIRNKLGLRKRAQIATWVTEQTTS